jgi:ADP-heptose:LPS heptosyltransferase
VDVVEAYGDGLIKVGTSGRLIQCDPGSRQRSQWCQTVDFNYLGTYITELGIKLESPPSVELPQVPPILSSGEPYICLQPRSATWGYPANKEAVFASVVSAVRAVRPLWPIIVVGHAETPRDIPGVIFDFLGTPMSMLRLIRHSKFVITVRSVSAHIASAYGVPSIVFSPDDGEHWSLNYPKWNRKIVPLNIAEETIGKNVMESVGSVV